MSHRIAKNGMWILMGLCLLSVERPVWGRSNHDLKQDVETLEEGQAKIQAELATVERLLQQLNQAQVKPEILSLEGAPYLGSGQAKVALIEFGDYECHFCGEFFRDDRPRLLSEYVNTGKLIYAFRDFPLEAVHPNALTAAEAARCAGQQGKYWKMHEELFRHQAALAGPDILRYAQAIGLKTAEFRQCLDAAGYKKEIESDLSEGMHDGVQGTPTFFLGLIRPDRSSIEAVRIIRGSPPYVVLQEDIENLLNKP